MDPRLAALEADEASRFGGTVHGRREVRARPGPAVYVLTAAQNNTHVHKGLWRNLQAYTKHRGAQLLVSQFTYNKAAFGERAVKPGTQQVSDFDSLWYATEIEPHRFNDRLAITRQLTFCGEVNISPTAESPLSGFENYTGRSSAIFPHAKQAMTSVASTHATKLLYTTGCCTLRNYLQKKAGLKGEYQHAYGALIVEVDGEGAWFVRQLRATENGDFQDLDVTVKHGKVRAGARIEALQPGDVHVAQLDPVVRQVIWGCGGMVDVLRPRYQFLHDLLDFLSRNHHESKNPHELFRKWVRGLESVEGELRSVAQFLTDEAVRPWCRTVVVDSNHDRALTRWLKESDFRADPVNAAFYLRAQRMVYDAIVAGREDQHLLGELLQHLGAPRGVKFLQPGESFVTCRAAGGIENGMHGDTGPNGSRGSARAFSRMGRRVNVGHAHSAGIVGDAFIAGTASLLRMNYNKGAPSSWSHTLIATYPNGCRALITIWSGKWRA